MEYDVPLAIGIKGDEGKRGISFFAFTLSDWDMIEVSIENFIHNEAGYIDPGVYRAIVSVEYLKRAVVPKVTVLSIRQTCDRSYLHEKGLI